MKIKKILTKLIVICLITCFVIGAIVLGLNFYIIKSVKRNVISVDDTASLEDVDCIIVLGCGVYADGTLSPMLNDRLSLAADVYGKGASEKLLMSGDHGTEYYNEVSAMKNYMTSNGIASSSDIFMDHAGFSTYESIYRVKEIFGAKKIVIVTNTYHLYRALYIAKCFGLDAYGVGVDDTYTGREYREVREILARDKDFAKCIVKPEPTFLGESIDLKGDGNVTEDKSTD
ncbi:protein SanA, affects membrane permeability for vancomycin [Lachnospiraceae bacterium NE2001]|nr:protein SanA, affects membrane permeability for vancomycin [Lachnospiraceae bacterium NE2001]